jgi:plasmid maintenance system antidote protein VapI
VGERHNQQLIAAQRRERAVTMYLYGHSQEEIARELGVSQSRISRLVRQARAGWHQQATAEIADHVADQLARIQRLEREYWLAWERSRQTRERTQTVQEDATLTGTPELPPGVPLRLPYGKRRASGPARGARWRGGVPQRHRLVHQRAVEIARSRRPDQDRRDRPCSGTGAGGGPR